METQALKIAGFTSENTVKQNLILLHGLFGALSNWQSVIKEFSRDYHVFTPELPLFDSTISDSHLNRLVKFLEKYIDVHHIQNPVLVGNSLGGHIAILYTLKHPQHVSTLILSGSSGLYENTFGNSFPRISDTEYIKDRIFDVFYNKNVIDDHLIDGVFEVLQNKRKALSVIGIARDAKKQNLKNELPNIKIPVLLIWGIQDFITPLSVAEEFYLSLSNAKLCLINECGHVPMMEQPETFNELLKDFLDKRHLKIV
jgi:2-hydroxy-6-oxonona-2,4-dienedioate hydrolase